MPLPLVSLVTMPIKFLPSCYIDSSFASVTSIAFASQSLSETSSAVLNCIVTIPFQVTLQLHSLACSHLNEITLTRLVEWFNVVEFVASNFFYQFSKTFCWSKLKHDISGLALILQMCIPLCTDLEVLSIYVRLVSEPLHYIRHSWANFMEACPLFICNWCHFFQATFEFATNLWHNLSCFKV